MTEKSSSIEMSGYDAQGPETKENIASISFKDPEDNNGNYCVGFKFKGGSLSDSGNWKYDHTNYWTSATIEDDSILEVPVDREEVIKVLKRQGETLDTLLKRYIDLLN